MSSSAEKPWVPLSVFEALPKTDLHVHLDGSLRLKTILELAQQQGVKLPAETAQGLHEAIGVGRNCGSLEEYLRGFAITPFRRHAELSSLLEPSGRGGLMVKDETGNVSGSHKARHLFGTMLELLLAGVPFLNGDFLPHEAMQASRVVWSLASAGTAACLGARRPVQRPKWRAMWATTCSGERSSTSTLTTRCRASRVPLTTASPLI